jgi:hypothetical protein
VWFKHSLVEEIAIPPAETGEEYEDPLLAGPKVS